ncbi:unnamed protein product [Amoebophrya sp. A25]|nr:unnamed protein product [Amoebophrya sp. A25]|eukprot:GSA25T00001526001.1
MEEANVDNENPENEARDDDGITAKKKSATTKIEICFTTLNIHGGNDVEAQVLYEYFAAFPRPVGVLALQECPRTILQWQFPPGKNLWSSLDLRYCHYAGADYMGNLLLSRYPFTEEGAESVYLEAGCTSSQRKTAEMRSAAVAKIRLSPNAEIRIAATHLDHRFEQSRLMQLDFLLGSAFPADVEQPPRRCFDVLLGDLNALKKKDYSSEDLKEIAEVRARSSWESPRFEVTDLLQKSGWKDSILGSTTRTISSSNQQQRLQEANSNTKYQEKMEGSGTSSLLVSQPPRWSLHRGGGVQGTAGHYETRIDYIWFRETPMTPSARATTEPKASTTTASVDRPPLNKKRAREVRCKNSDCTPVQVLGTKYNSKHPSIVAKDYEVFQPKRRFEKNVFTDHACVTCVLGFDIEEENSE